MLLFGLSVVCGFVGSRASVEQPGSSCHKITIKKSKVKFNTMGHSHFFILVDVDVVADIKSTIVVPVIRRILH